MEANDFKSSDPITWCPHCGDFGILNSLKRALARLGRNPKDILLVSGIGQAAKMPHYVKANCFNGLHGRALPAAFGARVANKDLTIIVTTGDGDCYGEGGNHFIHNIRRNPDITVIVCNNQIYGLTKGQASPTTDEHMITKITPRGVILEHLSPLSLALSAGAGFVSRGFAQDTDHLTDLILAGIHYRGFALIDVLQPCVTFNRKNTYEWYAERVYKLDASYNSADLGIAFQKSLEWGEGIPIGILYNVSKPTYEQKAGLAD
ncbi:MAG: 2-oxoacid:ferredoxin oxidoreductase subunit beta [Deltaproteobacteria bacterium]